MYQAKLHPEQYSNTFSDAQVKTLHDAMMYVCDTAVETLAESDRFPEDWLMKHRWSKGKKDGGKLPNGEKITFLKVGGRTSAIVPSVQKKTGAVAGESLEDVDGAEDDGDDPQPKKGTKRKNKVKKEAIDDDDSEEKFPMSTKRGRGRKAAEQPVKKEEEEEHEDEEEAPKVKKQKVSASAPSRKPPAAKAAKATAESEEPGAVNGRRRSGRASRT